MLLDNLFPNFKFFIILNYVNMCTCARVCVSVYLCVCMSLWVQVSERPEMFHSLEVELQIAVICLMWVLRIEAGSSRRAVHTVNHWVLSLGPLLDIFEIDLLPICISSLKQFLRISSMSTTSISLPHPQFLPCFPSSSHDLFFDYYCYTCINM